MNAIRSFIMKIFYLILPKIITYKKVIHIKNTNYTQLIHLISSFIINTADDLSTDFASANNNNIILFFFFFFK